MEQLSVHDLVRLASPTSIAAGADAPAWVPTALEAAPWVVVRRAAPIDGLAPIGVRGASRAERFGGTARLSEIVERLRPADLRKRRPPRPHPVFEAMERLSDVLDASGCAWGPGGSAGFELAAGRPTLTPDSDLDLVLRCEELPDERALALLLSAAEAAPVRVDVLIETPAGGVALADLLGVGDEILLRAASGPRLVRRAERSVTVAPC